MTPTLNKDLNYRLQSRGDNTFGSIRLSVHQRSHAKTWNTTQDLCLFVSNQETCAIKELRAAVGDFCFCSMHLICKMSQRYYVSAFICKQFLPIFRINDLPGKESVLFGSALVQKLKFVAPCLNTMKKLDIDVSPHASVINFD